MFNRFSAVYRLLIMSTSFFGNFLIKLKKFNLIRCIRRIYFVVKCIELGKSVINLFCRYNVIVRCNDAVTIHVEDW